jgi:MYXO-CTERM domain-containing protein
MRRVLIGLAAMTMATVAFALPAQAKPFEGQTNVTEDVAIMGPGLLEPVVLTGDDAFAYANMGGAWTDFTKGTTHPSSVELGPAYQVTYTVSCDGGPVSTIHQVLFPYYRFGPWTYTPAAQSSCMGTSAVSGWYGADPQLFDVLTSAGLASKAPAVAAPGSVAQPQPEPDGSSRWPLFAGVFGLLVLLALGAVAVRPRRKAPVATNV